MRMRVPGKGRAMQCSKNIWANRVVYLKICGQFLIALVICDIGFLDGRKAFATDVNEEGKMGFVNEYASDEDIEKYKIHEILDKYKPFRKKSSRRPGFTIDRKRNVFLIVVERGFREEGNEVTFLLWLDGTQILARLKQEGGSSKLDARPFYRVWHLLKLDRPEEFILSEAEVVRILKDALEIYGYWGVQQQIPNTLVKFRF